MIYFWKFSRFLSLLVSTFNQILNLGFLNNLYKKFGWKLKFFCDGKLHFALFLTLARKVISSISSLSSLIVVNIHQCQRLPISLMENEMLATHGGTKTSMYL